MRLDLDTGGRTGLWIALVAAPSIMFSWALACIAPFAAIATVSGVYLPRRLAVMTIIGAWLANQAVGYLVLGYPRTPDSAAWGVAIGLSALLATLAARSAARRVPPRVWKLVAAFVAAFIVYEGALYAATAVLPSGDDAFSLAVVALVLKIDLLALVGLLLLRRAALATGLLSHATAKALPA